MEKSKLPLVSKTAPWGNNPNKIWLASTVSLSRNIDRFNFPNKLGEEKKKQIITLIGEPLLGSNLLDNPVLVKADEMTPLDKEFLYEHFLTNRSFHQAHGGEGFVVDGSGCFLAALNMRDHLLLQMIDCREEIEDTWNFLVKIETSLGQKISYAFNSKFGFLTADPADAGTGLTVSIFLQVTALIHLNRLEDFIDTHRDDAVSITGLQGKAGEMIGDLLTIRNNYSLGLTEENILTSLRSFATKIHMAEKSARSELRQNGAHAHIKDMVGRAYGLLEHSYQMETIEALNAISLLKLGVELGWVSGITMPVLNALFFQCRRAHLLYQLNEEAPQQELLHKRAEYIHKVLQEAKLQV